MVAANGPPGAGGVPRTGGRSSTGWSDQNGGPLRRPDRTTVRPGVGSVASGWPGLSGRGGGQRGGAPPPRGRPGHRRAFGLASSAGRGASHQRAPPAVRQAHHGSAISPVRIRSQRGGADLFRGRHPIPFFDRLGHAASAPAAVAHRAPRSGNDRGRRVLTGLSAVRLHPGLRQPLPLRPRHRHRNPADARHLGRQPDRLSRRGTLVRLVAGRPVDRLRQGGAAPVALVSVPSRSRSPRHGRVHPLSVCRRLQSDARTSDRRGCNGSRRIGGQNHRSDAVHPGPDLAPGGA